jgi:hypothetical protein
VVAVVAVTVVGVMEKYEMQDARYPLTNGHPYRKKKRKLFGINDLNTLPNANSVRSQPLQLRT